MTTNGQGNKRANQVLTAGNPQNTTVAKGYGVGGTYFGN